jgi:ribonuclease Z
MVIRVTFLGTGSALPSRGAANCAYLIRAGDATILVDCGPAILQQLDAVNVSPGEITHVFVTHRHGDHILGYPMVVLWWALKFPPDRRMPTVIASHTTFDSLDGLVLHSYGDPRLWARAQEIPRVVLPVDQAAETRINDAITLRSAPMLHSDWAPVLGGRFEIIDGEPDSRRGRQVKARVVTLAFTGDTTPSEGVVDLARNADLLVHDAAISATLTPAFKMGAHGHSSAEAAAELAQRAGARHLALVHLEGENVDAGLTDIYLAEATRAFHGTVSIPLAGLTLEY